MAGLLRRLWYSRLSTFDASFLDYLHLLEQESIDVEYAIDALLIERGELGSLRMGFRGGGALGGGGCRWGRDGHRRRGCI